MAKKKKKTGRPLKKISDREVLNLASVGCTNEEIAAMLDCGITTLKRRFGPVIKRGRNMARGSLRRAQFKAALAGNATMLIWLGKQLLGQKNEPLCVQAEIEAAPSMIEMAAAMDCSIPLRPENSDGNGAAKRRDNMPDTDLPRRY